MPAKHRRGEERKPRWYGLSGLSSLSSSCLTTDSYHLFAAYESSVPPSLLINLMESAKDEGNESAITRNSERSDQGGRNGCLDGCPLSSYGQARIYISRSN